MDGSCSFTGTSIESLKNDPAHRRAHVSAGVSMGTNLCVIIQGVRKIVSVENHVQKCILCANRKKYRNCHFNENTYIVF